MPRHALRLLLVGLLTLAALVGVIVLIAIDRSSAPEFVAVSTALGLLVPALIDSAAVERRRRNPNARAIEDDVKPPDGA